MSISGFFKFITGFVLGVIFFTAGIGGGVYFFLNKMAVEPSKPVFSEEKPPEEKSSEANANSDTNDNSNSDNKSSGKNEDLPSGAYRARVTWSSGLSLRAEPDKNAERIGGVGYNWEIIILSENDNKEWQKIRIPSSGQEGWVKAGNIEKVN